MNTAANQLPGGCSAQSAAGEQTGGPGSPDALGRLAGGVAHDLNNLLTVINGGASLLLDDPDLAPDALGAARRIAAAGERAANLSRQLLLFSGEHPHHPRVLAPNALLSGLAEALRRLAGAEVALELQLSPDAPPVAADPAMMEQVVANLTANARDAMPHGGRLVVSTAAVALGDSAATEHPAARPGNFLCLGVADEGSGIAAEALPHIFEPFFTTRPAGHGCGLGLAVVFGIVRRHGGWLTVKTTVGGGSCFSVFLPAAPAGAAVEDCAEPVSLLGHETILLVEDDELVRETTAALLQHSGYRVLRAASGAEAMETWRWHSARIALMLTDVVLPDGMSGLELAASLRAEQPALKVICISGYSRDMLAQMSRPPAGILFLQKPCPPQRLTKAMRLLLDEARPATPTP